jgi:hypothetical protein
VNFRPSYLEQFNLTVEKDLHGTVIQATYAGILGRHLASVFNDQNVPAPISNTALNALAAAQGTNPATAFNTLRPYNNSLPNVTQIGGYFSTGASSYHSLQLSVTRRTQRGLTLGANYTLAHGLDDVLGLSNEINDGYGVIPSQIRTLDYGNSDVDIRNRGVLTANYALPFGKNLLRCRRGTRRRLASEYSDGLGIGRAVYSNQLAKHCPYHEFRILGQAQSASQGFPERFEDSGVLRHHRLRSTTLGRSR